MTQLTEMPENQRSNPVILNIGLPSTVHRKDEHGEAALAPRDFVCAYQQPGFESQAHHLRFFNL